MKLGAWLREPLVHFLLAGGLLFVAASAWEKGNDEGRRISLEREDLLVFMQGRAQVYDEASFSGLLAGMDSRERERLVRDAALQEVLYREGEALNLAKADPLIRQRVVQQMRLLVMEEAAAGMTVSDEELRAFFERNRQEYALAPSVTFTHVFLPGVDARAKAEQQLADLRRSAVPFDRAGRYGERFLYQINYADVGSDLVASHFGKEFADKVFDLEPSTWQGPIRSEHGWHLVLVLRNNAGRMPQFADVKATVREDALAEKRQLAAGKALDSMLGRYQIVVEDKLAK
jgi:parvulin-like peptidyl-prolyl isomerase